MFLKMGTKMFVFGTKDEGSTSFLVTNGKWNESIEDVYGRLLYSNWLRRCVI